MKIILYYNIILIKNIGQICAWNIFGEYKLRIYITKFFWTVYFLFSNVSTIL